MPDILNTLFILQVFPYNIKQLKWLSEINSALTNNVIRTNYSDEYTDHPFESIWILLYHGWIFTVHNSASQFLVKLSINAALSVQSLNSRGSRPQQVAASLTLKGS